MAGLETGELFHVVMNDEEQYSIWQSTSSAPPGWAVVSEPLSKDAALDHIERVWTDMRPRSART
jgi:MbtH protein